MVTLLVIITVALVLGVTLIILGITLGGKSPWTRNLALPLALLAGYATTANELPEAPIAKLSISRPESRIDKFLVAAHAAAATYDLVTTRICVQQGWVEVDPLTRPLIGERPGVARMLAFGSLEVAGAAWLARRNPRVGHVVQIAAIAAHVAAASHNLTLGQRR